MGEYRSTAPEDAAQHAADMESIAKPEESKAAIEERMLNLLVEVQAQGVTGDALVEAYAKKVVPNDPERLERLLNSVSKKPYIRGAGHGEGSGLRDSI